MFLRAATFLSRSHRFACAQPFHTVRPCSTFTIPSETTLPEFHIVDSTLREGEQFSSTSFTLQDRVYIAKTLDRLGVEYIELSNPIASQQALRDCRTLSGLRLRSKLLAHTRCHMDDVMCAVESGVQGVNIYMATSPILRKHSHGKGIDAVMEMASEVVNYVKRHGLEVRFSCEDTFRSDSSEFLRIYKEMNRIGVHRVGIADTVGVATPFQVYQTIRSVREVISPETGIEFHGHNDSGCCVANAYMAILAGATHIDTCVLGIGERNGITPLGGLLSRLYTVNKEQIKAKYDLNYLKFLDKYVAQAAKISIPFNNYITGTAAFTHKAGVHSKAVMSDPGAYEVLNPGDFGVERRIEFAHRLTGWNALSNRAKQLGVDLTDDQVKAATSLIKNAADENRITQDELDGILMRLSSGPRTSSSAFAGLVKAPHDDDVQSPELRAAAEAAASAVAAYEKAAAASAWRSVRKAQTDLRPTRIIRVEGHLFDKAVLNRILDLLVDSACDFKVVSLDVAPRNELHSTVDVQLWGDSERVIEETVAQMDALVKSNMPFAECKMAEVLPNPEATE